MASPLLRFVGSVLFKRSRTTPCKWRGSTQPNAATNPEATGRVSLARSRETIERFHLTALDGLDREGER